MLEKRLKKACKEGRLAQELVRLGFWEPELLEVEFHQPPDDHIMKAHWVTTDPLIVDDKFVSILGRPSITNWLYCGSNVYDVNFVKNVYLCGPPEHKDRLVQDDDFWAALMAMVRRNLVGRKAIRDENQV